MKDESEGKYWLINMYFMRSPLGNKRTTESVLIQDPSVDGARGKCPPCDTLTARILCLIKTVSAVRHIIHTINAEDTGVDIWGG